MKNSLLILSIVSLSIFACTGSNSEPLKNSNEALTAAFSDYGFTKANPQGYFGPVQVTGEKCVEVKKGQKAECTVDKIVLSAKNFDINVKGENGFISGFTVSMGTWDREGNLDFLKKGESIALIGSVDIYKDGNFWKLGKYKLKKP